MEFAWSGTAGLPLKTEILTAGSRSTLIIPASLRGSALILTVRGINADGIASATVSTSVAVDKGDFTATWNGVVSGKPAVGQKLSVAAPAVNPAGQVTYKWYRGGSEIRGAVASSYTVTPADATQKLSVRLTVTGEGMNPLTLTSKTVTVASGVFSSSPAPAITGSATVGAKLTAAPGTWSPSDAALGYQWYRGSSAISGATGRTYTATAADLGKDLKVRVRASRAGYTTLDRWSSPRRIAAGTITAIRWPAVSGTARFGQTLKVSQEWTSGSAVAYQWYSNGKPISGGTKSSLYLTTSYVGAKVSVRVTVSKPGYTTRQVTTQAVTVGKASMVIKVNPKISGTTKAGNKLTAASWSFSPTPSAYTYQWFRNGGAIPGANRNSYLLAAADGGTKITVRVTAVKAGYHNLTATSGAVSIYLPPRTVISRDGTFRVGSEIKPGLYRATGTGNSCYWETTSGFSGSFDELNSNYFGSARTYVQILPSDRGFKTSGCGTWTTVPTTGANASKITTDGTFRVGIDIRPGLYQISGTGTSCYWETTSGFSGGFDELIDNYFGSARSYVEIPSSARGFTVSKCGTLTRIS
ncbi:hypothetical protein C4K88_16460 [Arthrobacter pityocampae]|uniref:Ig-like domain-containing protein n=1 Tax=Arthrobacter pityocampae TaxID=547334 RepID=A0A2S5IU34_9MICC|nr:hypothetical protein C4K88_16460 [Arthrobacter pityocampae]